MAVAGAIAALGAIVSAYATYQAGRQRADALKYEAEVAGLQATQAQQAAATRAEDAAERHRRILATQRAQFGAAGVLGGEGTPLIVALESAEQAALEEARLRYGGAVQAQGLETTGRLRRFEAGAARRGAVIAAGGSLLSGVGGAYGAYSRSRAPSDPYAGGANAL